MNPTLTQVEIYAVPIALAAPFIGIALGLLKNYFRDRRRSHA